LIILRHRFQCPTKAKLVKKPKYLGSCFVKSLPWLMNRNLLLKILIYLYRNITILCVKIFSVTRALHEYCDTQWTPINQSKWWQKRLTIGQILKIKILDILMVMRRERFARKKWTWSTQRRWMIRTRPSIWSFFQWTLVMAQLKQGTQLLGFKSNQFQFLH